IVVIIERRRTYGGSVAREIDSNQTGAASECRTPDVCDAAGNCDAGQAAVGPERPVPDVGDAIGDRVASGFTSRVLDEDGLILVEQDSSHTAIDGIECIHRYRG